MPKKMVIGTIFFGGFQIQKVVTIPYSIHPLHTQNTFQIRNPMVNEKGISFSVDPQKGRISSPQSCLTKNFRYKFLFIFHGRHDATNHISLKLIMNEKVFYLAHIGILCKNTLCATKRIKLLIWKGYHIFFTYSGGTNNLPTSFAPPQVVPISCSNTHISCMYAFLYVYH